MAWLNLLIAGCFEIFWAVGLKLSSGFTNVFISILTVIGMIASFYFLSLALKEIPLGTAYAVWTGIGTMGTVIFGILFFHEPVCTLRFLCIAMIFGGICGLRLISV